MSSCPSDCCLNCNQSKETIHYTFSTNPTTHHLSRCYRQFMQPKGNVTSRHVVIVNVQGCNGKAFNTIKTHKEGNPLRHFASILLWDGHRKFVGVYRLLLLKTCHLEQVRRNCSSLEPFVQRNIEYEGYLLHRNYSPSLLKKQFEREKAISRDGLTISKAKEAKKIFPFVLDFNPPLRKKCKHFIQESPLAVKYFPRGPIFVLIG